MRLLLSTECAYYSYIYGCTVAFVRPDEDEYVYNNNK